MGDWDINFFTPYVAPPPPPPPPPPPEPEPEPVAIEPAVAAPQDTSALSISSSDRFGGYAPSPEASAPIGDSKDFMPLGGGMSPPTEKSGSDILVDSGVAAKAENWKAQTTANSVDGSLVQNGDSAEGKFLAAKDAKIKNENAGDCGAGQALHNTPVDVLQNDVVGSLNEEQRAAFKELTPSERKDFVDIYRAVAPNNPGDVNDPGQKSTEALKVLLTSNAGMEDVDKNGKTVLETLGDAAGKNLAPELMMQGVDKKEALQSMVSELAFTNIYQGEGTDTCASATMQSLMTSGMPGEYARIATDLLFKGETTLQSGAQMKLSTSELPKTGFDLAQQGLPKDAREDGRNDFDKIIQGSFASFARTFDGTGEAYGGRRAGSSGTSAGDGNSSGTGLYNNQVKELYSNLTGNDAAVAKVTEENCGVLFDDLSAAVQGGLCIPVSIDADGEKNNYGHAVTVVAVGEQGVTYLDSLDQKKKTMPIEDFKENMSIDGMVVMPKEYAQGVDIVENPESHSSTDFFASLADRFMGAFGLQNAEAESSSGGRGGRSGTSI